jgi:phage shock protein PspC (stress-responsive transcriptional regulator)
MQTNISKFVLMFKQKKIRLFFERNGFAVSTRLAEVLGMKVKSVRLFFIYASFTTLIGGFLMYLTLAFWLKLKDMIYTKRSSVFDL